MSADLAPETASAGGLLVVVGPTASGKTELALRLAEALAGEIVNADSVQIYRHFDIGSAKPTASELARAPHHLVSAVEPFEDVEASRFAQLADAAISEIRARGKTPIVCGGTFLWVRALLFGLADAPPGDAEIRARHQEFAAREGREALHAKLAQVDSPSARRLHPNDLLRVSRALEVFELSGKRLSDLHGEHGFRTPRYRAHLLSVAWERAAYDAHVGERTRAMLDAGFIDEVAHLLTNGFGEARAMNAVGYRQVREALDAGKSAERDELAAEITRATRVFARRQRTWLREEAIDSLPAELRDSSEAFEALLGRCRAALSA